MGLSREHLVWVEDMEEKINYVLGGVKGISSQAEIQGVRDDIAKLRKDVKKMKEHLDRTAEAIMKALVE